MTLNERLQMLDIEREVQLGNIIKVDDSNLRCTRGLLPFVLTILDGVGALTLSNQQVGSVFLQYGKKGSGYVYIPEDVPSEQLPENFPTLQRLRELPEEYFFKPVGMFNQDIGDTLQFSLVRTEDKRVFVRCHYDLTRRRNI